MRTLSVILLLLAALASPSFADGGIERRGDVYTNPPAPPAVRVKRPPAPPRPRAESFGYVRRSLDVLYAEEIDRLGRVYDVDPLLIATLVRQESGFDPTAVSPVGAVGLMQLMPETAADLGVDPRDPAQNLNGGVAYLASLLGRFRDVKLALAAYNAGPEAVAAYGGVPPYPETQDYVATIYGGWRSGR